PNAQTAPMAEQGTLPGATPIESTPSAPPPVSTASGAEIGRTDLLGGWTLQSGGESCQLFMTLTSWTGGYRASTRGCQSATLKSISAWSLNGSQVVLAGANGVSVASLTSSGKTQFNGQLNSGGAVSFYR
ncbi:MAG: AprI/Inh family metalloprotease inhibitor, partial [Rhizobiales bacterium]|nr:AprI/Inh family metalloprotease inhibitor [Hyphomicrobiales bacterium]